MPFDTFDALRNCGEYLKYKIFFQHDSGFLALFSCNSNRVVSSRHKDPRRSSDGELRSGSKCPVWDLTQEWLDHAA